MAGRISVDKTQDLTAQLAQTAKYRRGFDEYGYFIKPTDFSPTLPCGFYRDSDGVVQTDMDFNLYKTDYAEIHVDGVTGVDATGDGSEEAPYKTIQKAVNIAESDAGTQHIIYLHGTYYDRNVCAISKTITKDISIVGVETEKTVLTTATTQLTWTDMGSGTFRATRSAVYAVFSRTIVDEYGEPVPLTFVASLEACQALAESWYTDDTYVYVHTSSGTQPLVAEYAICLTLTSVAITVTNDAKVYFENVRFMNGRPGANISFAGDANVQGTVIFNNCSAIGGQLRTMTTGGGNCLPFTNIKNIYMFNVIAAYSALDGFNYHYASTPVESLRDCLVLEYGCKAYQCGVYGTETIINNATTCHEGINVLRIGCIGKNTTGPVLADVNGCYSILIDCDMGESLLTSGDTNASYFFDSDSNPAGLTGKAILINCKGADADGYALSTEIGFDVRLYAFDGEPINATPKTIY